jgi:hypothetical protein
MQLFLSWRQTRPSLAHERTVRICTTSKDGRTQGSGATQGIRLVFLEKEKEKKKKKSKLESTQYQNSVFTALWYKPEGRGFEARCGELIFFNLSKPSVPLGPGVYSATSRNEYQKLKHNACGKQRAAGA